MYVVVVVVARFYKRGASPTLLLIDLFYKGCWLLLLLLCIKREWDKGSQKTNFWPFYLMLTVLAAERRPAAAAEEALSTFFY